jgi:hypothetical protein
MHYGASIYKLSNGHAFSDRKWDLYTKIGNTFFVIISFPIVDFVFSCQKIYKSLFRKNFLLAELGQFGKTFFFLERKI